MAVDGQLGGDLRLRKFPPRSAAIWLPPKDLALAAAMLSSVPNGRRLAIEVGVWKGAWSIGVLLNVDGSSIIGVDPFPGPSGPGTEAQLREFVAISGVGQRFSLVRSTAEAEALTPTRAPTLIHVDGEHTESSATLDLEWAGRVLAPDGIIVVDDYRHVWFPGVSSAVYGFIRSSPFRMVLATENKAYLCREEAHADWYHWLEKTLHGQRLLEWARHYGEADSTPYIQVPDVLSHRVIMVVGASDVLPKSGSYGRLAERFRRWAVDLLPPALLRGALRVRAAMLGRFGRERILSA